MAQDEKQQRDGPEEQTGRDTQHVGGRESLQIHSSSLPCQLHPISSPESFIIGHTTTIRNAILLCFAKPAMPLVVVVVVVVVAFAGAGAGAGCWVLGAGAGAGGISSPAHGIHPRLSGFRFLRHELHFFSVLSDPVLIGKPWKTILQKYEES